MKLYCKYFKIKIAINTFTNNTKYENEIKPSYITACRQDITKKIYININSLLLNENKRAIFLRINI